VLAENARAEDVPLDGRRERRLVELHPTHAASSVEQ
jgi:hypothetical protein